MDTRRLDRVEEEARRAQAAYIRSLSDEELAALIEPLPPELEEHQQRALALLTDDELEAIVDGEPWALARFDDAWRQTTLASD